MSSDTSLWRVPRNPLATHLALPNRVLRGRVYIALPCCALYGLSCGAILLCDLSRSTAHVREIPTEALPLGGPHSLIVRRAIFFADARALEPVAPTPIGR